jgi:hypothetical protein
MKNPKGLFIPLAFILSLAQLLLILSTWQLLPPQIPLYYSLPWGDSQLAQPIAIFILPASSLAVTMFNSLTGVLIFKNKTLIRLVLSASAMLFSFFALVTLIQIIRLAI